MLNQHAAENVSAVSQSVSDSDSSSICETEQQIETEYRREVYLQAAERIQTEVDPATWQAFQQTVVQGRAISEMATELGKSTGTIYAARSRIMRRLREAVKFIEGSEQ